MRSTVILSLFAIVCLVSALAWSQIPPTLSYQGVLRTTTGVIVPDDDYLITFRIYDQESGGTALWEEDQTLAVADGMINAQVGSVAPIGLTFDTPYWVALSVDGGEELSPRIKLSTTPYAFRSLYADIPEDADWSIVGDDIYRMNGRVGIGTPTPQSDLHVAGFARVDSALVTNRIGSLSSAASIQHDPSLRDDVLPGRQDAVALGSKKLPDRTDPTRRGTRPALDRAGADLELQTDGQTRLFISGDTGNLGVGTMTPAERLDVAGTVRSQGFELPTDAGLNKVLTSDETGRASWRTWGEGRVPMVTYADRYDSLSSAGLKIAAAIGDLPATGGVVDARGLNGGDIDVNMFEGVKTNVTLLLGSGTFVVKIPQVFNGTRTGSLRVIGVGLSTVIQPTSSMQVFRVSGEGGRFESMKFDLNGTSSTAIAFSSVHWFNGEVEHVTLNGSSGSAPYLLLGEDWEHAGALGAFVKDVDIWGTTTQDGIEIHAEMVVIDGCTINQCRSCITLDGGTSSTISNCSLGHSKHALTIDQGSYDTLLFYGNDCESGYNNEGFIRIIGSAAQFPIRNVIIRDNYFTQMNSPQMDAIYLKNVYGVLIEGNRFAGGYPGTGAHAVVFDTDVTDVTLASNISFYIETSMPGFDTVGLRVDDIRAVQTSLEGAFGADLTVGGLLRLNPQDSPPEEPREGDVYMDAITHKLMVFDGVSWRACW